MKKRISKKSGVIISADISINKIEKLKKEMNKEMKTAHEINISAENIENIDITGIQFLYALKKEARLQNKKVNWSIELDPQQQERMEIAGFGTLLNNEI